MEAGNISRFKILELAARLLTDIRPDDLSLDLLAQKTGIEKSALLLHFESKEDLLLGVVKDQFDHFSRNFLGKYMNLRPVEVLEIFFKDYEKFIRENPQVTYIILSCLLHAKEDSALRIKLQEFYRNFREMISKHLRLANNEMGKHFAGIIVAVLDGFYLQWTLEPEEIDLRKSIDIVKNLIKQFYGNKMSG